MSSDRRQVLLSVPNILTYVRIAFIPAIMALMMVQGPHRSYEANYILSLSSAFLFVIAGISDLVDGYYARKHKMVSIMGKFFDPTADKLLHMAVMIMLIPMGRFPAWLVVVLLFREILVAGLRSVAAGEGVLIEAGPGGKRKTAWLTCGLTALLIYYPLGPFNSYAIGWVCVVIGSIYSFYSGGEYLLLFLKKFAHKRGD